jgi:transposase
MSSYSRGNGDKKKYTYMQEQNEKEKKKFIKHIKLRARLRKKRKFHITQTNGHFARFHSTHQLIYSLSISMYLVGAFYV